MVECVTAREQDGFALVQTGQADNTLAFVERASILCRSRHAIPFRERMAAGFLLGDSVPTPVRRARSARADDGMRLVLLRKSCSVMLTEHADRKI
jgi:hypothetical protein